MAQEPSSRDLLEAVKQQESGGRRYKADGKTLLEGPPTKYGTAKGEMQVLDMTNKDPGFGVRPAKNDSAEERARVGRDYLAAMKKRYGDTETGLIAYNWGPGNTDKWIKRGADPAKLPKETQNYVTSIMASLGGPDVSRETSAAKKTAPKPVVVAAARPGVAGTTSKKPAPAAAPKAVAPAAAPVTVASMDSRLADLGPSYQAALALSFLADTDEKEDRDIDREPGVAEKYLAEMEAAPRPAALSEFIDVKIRSPFAEAEQPVGMAEGGEVADKDAQGDTSDALSNEPIGLLDKYRMFSWMEKNYPEMLTYNNNEPAVFLSIMRGQSTYSDTDPQEQLLRKRKVNPIAEPDFFQKQPGEPVFPQRREMSRPENFDYPRLERGDDPALERKEMEKLLGQRNLGTFYANGGVVRRAGGSPETGEVGYFQDPFGVPDSGPVTSDTLAKGKEFSAADALRALKEVGEGGARNLKNIAKGTTELPYNFFGGAADIGNMVLTPLGLGSAEPTFGSAHLKRLATEAGIRPAPPTDPRDAGFYMMGELSSSVLNPTGVVRSGVKATGKAAKMLEDMTVGNVQRGQVRRAGAQAENIPDTAYDPLRQRMEASGNLAYAVRNKATPFLMTKRPDTSVNAFIEEMSNAEKTSFRKKYPDLSFFDTKAGNIGIDTRGLKGTEEYKDFIKPIDEPEYFVKYSITDNENRIALENTDPILNNWFNKAVPSYFRKDFATPEDQFVKAADQDKLLHFEPKKGPRADEIASIEKQKDAIVRNTREVEGFNIEGEAKTPYGERVENTIDKAVYPVQLQDIGRESQIPPSLLKFLETNPEKRASELTPMTDKRLKLSELRKDMLRIRQIGPEYAAYGQPAQVIPKDFTLPDDLLPRFNLAEASNRVARFTRWEEDTRPRMATAALLTDPSLRRDPIQNGKYMSVALPDPVQRPEFKALVTDVGCDGGWCTAQEKYALSIGSGESRLHVLVTNAEKPRPVTQVSVEKIGTDKDGSGMYAVTDIKEKGDTENFKTNPELPAIQKQVQLLDSVYGGFEGVHALDKLGMEQIPKNSPVWLAASMPLSQALDLKNSFKGIREEAIRLNDGSQYVIGETKDVNNLLEQAFKNISGPQQRAMGGMVQGYAKGGIADLPKGYSEDDATTLKPFLPTTTPTANNAGIATIVPGYGNPNAAANQAASFAKLTPAQLAQHQVQLAMISDAKPTVVQFMFAIKDAVQNAINNSTTTSSGGVSGDSGSPMGGIASKGTVSQANAAVAAANAAAAKGTAGGTSGGATAGNGSGASTAGGSSPGSAYSDVRMKDNIKPIGNALSKVKKLDGITYDMNGQRGAGLAAQQVEKVLPEVVHKDAKGMRKVDYGKTVGLLVEAVKELDAKKKAGGGMIERQFTDNRRYM